VITRDSRASFSVGSAGKDGVENSNMSRPAPPRASLHHGKEEEEEFVQ